MQKVKGSIVIAIPKYIKEKFGENGYSKWFLNLSNEARQVFNDGIIINEWYDLKKMAHEPTKVFCDIFFGGDVEKGAWECGRYAADFGLRGVYKIFLKFGSPEFVLKRGAAIIATYYNPGTVDVSIDGMSANAKYINFEEMYETIEYRIGGWTERAGEICGCTKIDVEILKSMSKGDSLVEYSIRWNI